MHRQSKGCRFHFLQWKCFMHIIGRWTSSIIPNRFEICGYKFIGFQIFHTILNCCTRRHYPLLNELYRVISNLSFNITIHICFVE